MNFIDLIFCVPLVWGIYKGFTKGFIIEIASFIAFALGIWGGVKFSDFIAHKLTEQFNWHSAYLPIISFVIVFLAIIITVFFVAKLVQKIIEGMALSAINKIAGAVVGFLKFALIISVFIFVVDAIEKSYPLISFKSKEESLLYKPLGKIAPAIIPSLNQSKINAIIPEK